MVAVLLLTVAGAVVLSAGAAARILRPALAGQPRAHRSDPAQPRTDLRPASAWCSPRICRRFSWNWFASRSASMRESTRPWRSLVAIGLIDAEEINSLKRTILSHHVYESVPVKLQLDDEEMARFAVHRYEFTGRRHPHPAVAPLPVRHRWRCMPWAMSPPSASRTSSTSIPRPTRAPLSSASWESKAPIENLNCTASPGYRRSAGQRGRPAGRTPGSVHPQTRCASAYRRRGSGLDPRYARTACRRRGT